MNCTTCDKRLHPHNRRGTCANCARLLGQQTGMRNTTQQAAVAFRAPLVAAHAVRVAAEEARLAGKGVEA